MNRGRINQGVLLILVGLYFLLRNLGWIDGSFLQILLANWPVLLIFAGIYVMLSRSALWFVPAILSIVLFLMFAGLIPSPLGPEAPYVATPFAHPVDVEAQALAVTFDSPAAHIRLAAGGGYEVSGTTSYAGTAPKMSARLIGDRFVVDFYHVQQLRRWFFENVRAPHWDVAVPAHLPLSVTVRAAYGDVTLDLQGLDARNIDIESAAGTIDILFDESVTVARVELDTTSSVVRLFVPEGIGVRVESNAAFVANNLTDLGFTRDGNLYVSPEYETASSRVEVHLHSAVGKLSITRERLSTASGAVQTAGVR